MTELKFRIWDSDNRVFTYLDFSNLERTISILNSYSNYFSSHYLEDNQYIQFSVGLKDKKDKEIYVGDIIKFKTTSGYNNFTVEYLENYAQYWGRVYGGFCLTLYDLKRTGEVIGNIFENPELLEK